MPLVVRGALLLLLGIAWSADGDARRAAAPKPSVDPRLDRISSYYSSNEHPSRKPPPPPSPPDATFGSKTTGLLDQLHNSATRRSSGRPVPPPATGSAPPSVRAAHAGLATEKHLSRPRHTHTQSERQRARAGGRKALAAGTAVALL